MSDVSPDAAFATLPLAPALIDNLASLGFAAMTPIQAEGLPPILAGRDVLARAKTGSGKTAAFGLGLLSRLDLASFRVRGSSSARPGSWPTRWPASCVGWRAPFPTSRC